MDLQERITAAGNWLFRHRGWLPLLLIPLSLLAVHSVEVSEHSTIAPDEVLYETCGLLIAFSGLMLRCYVVGTVPKGTSGRNTTSQEASVLNTTGMYSIVRHPLYIGNYLIMLGCTVFTGSWWLPLVTSLLFFPYYGSIVLSEEQYLRARFGDNFTCWARITPRFVPRFRNWQSTVLRFSWRTALRREYGGLLTIVAFCSLSEVIGDLVFDPVGPYVEVVWVATLIVGTALAVSLRTVKRRTTLLEVDGRP